MEISIQKWGNSAAMRLPADLLKRLNIAPGDKLAVEILPDGIMLKMKRPSFKLADLLAKCDKNAKQPAGMDVWNNIVPVGDEVW